jgi:hypothetical protein
MQKLVPSIAAVTAASAAAFAGLAAFATKATQAAIEDQAEQERLAQTLQKVVGATDEAVASTEKFIANLAKTTTFSDSQLRPALSSLVVATGDLTRAQDLLTTAQDISVATGTDLQQVSEALAKASNGNMKALQALSPTLRDNIKEGQSFDQVLRELQANFGGAADAASKTLAGQMTILRNRFDEIVESIGTAFLPIIQVLANALSGVATFIEENTTLVIFLTSALLTITGTITALVAVWGAYKAAVALAAAANYLFSASLTATGIGAVVVAIGLLVGAFVTLVAKTGGVSNAFKTMGNFIILVTEQFVNNIIIGLNFIIQGINTLIDGLQKIGVPIKNIGEIGSVQFGRIALSANNAANAINRVGIESDAAARRLAAANLQTGLVSVADAQNKLAVATGRVNQLRAQALKGGTSIEVLNQALKDQQNAQSVLNTLLGQTETKTGGATKATVTAAEKLKEYTSVLKSAQSASKSFGDAQKRVGKAQESVAEADKAVAAAQAALLKAQQAGSPAEIADAQRAVAAAERGLARAKFGQEEAIIAVRDAEKKLAEIRKDPESTPDEIRKAEIALAEAKFAVADAEDNQIEIANKLTEARRQLRIATKGLQEGDQELVPFQDAVTAAQKRQKDAAEAYQAAVENQTEALVRYKEALEELGKVAENFPKIAARVGAPNLIPILPDPTGGTAGATTTTPASTNVNVMVNSSVVNPQQVGQEIADYLRAYHLGGGDQRYYTAV